MSSKFTRLDTQRFGPWALVTGSSSGIGKEFAHQLAASGLNLILVARRQDALESLGHQLAADFGVEYRVVSLDLSDEGFLDRLEASTQDAGGALSFFTDMLDQDREGLHRMLRLNTAAHLDLAHHFGRRLAERGRGGLLLVSSLGARQGWPGAADYAASKAFVMVLGESLHLELAKLGVSVTVLLPGATETEMVRSYGVDAATMNQMMRPMRLMSVDQVVAEGLGALNANRPMHITGRLNRTMASLLPRGAFTRMLGSMTAQLRARQAAAQLP